MLTSRSMKLAGMLTCGIFALTMVLAPVAPGQALKKLSEWEEGRSMRAGSNAWNPNDLYDLATNL